MDSPALADLTQRVRGAGAGLAAELTLEASLGRIARRMHQQAEDERELQRAVQPVILPAVRLGVTAGVLGTDPALSLLGPEDGQAWDVRRLTVAGLVAGGGAVDANEGTQAAPAANTTIVSLPAAGITPGTYLINWTVSLAGTPGANDVDNFQLRIGTTTVLTSVNPGAVGNYPQLAYGPVQLGAAAVIIRSGGNAATAGSVYTAQISLTPLPNDQVSLYREQPGPVSGNPENLLWTFTPPGTSPGPTWNPGGGLILRAPEGLVLTGTGLAAAGVTLSGEAVAVETPWLPRYLL